MRNFLTTSYLVALAAAGCAADDIQPSAGALGSARPHEDIHGIYILGNSELKNLESTDAEHIDGYALRLGWIELDHGTTEGGPDYDFTAIDTAVTTLDAMGKRLTITIDAQLVPDYVLAAAETTYTTTVPGPGHTEYQAETAVTWDPPTLASYTDMLATLAAHRIGGIPLRDHPVLAGIRTNIIGMGKLRQTSNNTEGTIFEVPSYTRGRFVGAVLANLHAAQDPFPAIPTWVPYFSVNDEVSGVPQDPTLDEVLIAAITTEFDGSSRTRPVVGMFQELLKGNTPGVTGTDGTNLLAGRAGGAFIAFQACGGWTDQSLCTFIDGDTTPENGFDLGFGSYGAPYYELYAGDLGNPAFESMFLGWQAFLADPTDPSLNPVALVATATATSRKNVLTWLDTSTMETGYIVERAPAEAGPYDPIGTPGPDTTRFIDSRALTTGPSYYRVHATGIGGDFVLSNVASAPAH